MFLCKKFVSPIKAFYKVEEEEDDDDENSEEKLFWFNRTKLGLEKYTHGFVLPKLWLNNEKKNFLKIGGTPSKIALGSSYEKQKSCFNYISLRLDEKRFKKPNLFVHSGKNLPTYFSVNNSNFIFSVCVNSFRSFRLYKHLFFQKSILFFVSKKKINVMNFKSIKNVLSLLMINKFNIIVYF